MTIANNFFDLFGSDAFAGSRERSLRALKWMAEHDPDGTGELDADSMIILYNFSDKSKLLFDTKANRFFKPD